ncbi:TetR/AcrR family transcriptional regulator [Inquilinus sp. CA228]|uniref:TetR/AcrR family transcriptional regulator n=1 Tax=Inquilinus sp. CA228 TaxID=3455609 RepID=UPI003F8D83CC
MTEPPGPTRRPYHHGHLRDALIAAALQLIEEDGLDAVTVREAAKRAGVSPGAPFRHFPTKRALLTAVAEQAQERLGQEMAAALAATGGLDPLARFAETGAAYLRWATRNPTHFRIISSRRLIDFDSSPALREANAGLRDRITGLLQDAVRQGQLAAGTDIGHVRLAGRALVYGLARMAADGHFPEWGVPGESAERSMRAALDLVIGRIRTDGP